MGEIVRSPLPIYLHINIPEKSINVRIIKGGELVCQSGESNMEYPINTHGVYRVEVSYHRHPWIYSNPIYIQPR